MIVTRAPGKLFVAGEYAVVAPGEPAVLVAVDRFVTVHLTRSEVGKASVHSPDRGWSPLAWHADDDGGVHVDDGPHPYVHVVAALAVVERLRAERGLPARPAHVRVTSGLDDGAGRKYGLGSSAAVTVATVRALGLLHGLDLDDTGVFRLALLATLGVSPSASGGDVAASAFGGWLRYASPDRADLRARLDGSPVADLLTAPWPGLEISALPAPRALRLLVGWTGEPVSTDSQVAAVHRAPHDPAAFRAASRTCVDALTRGLRCGDDDAVTDAMRDARAVLARYARLTGTTIETDRLTTLCDLAERAGAAAKSSGAGGGDCGIALAPPDTDADALLAGWCDHGIEPLALRAAAPTDEPDRPTDPALEATR